ncbi:ABC transporter permease [bacterium AH-315-I11]|nr:ABC transporter permease [bacterium AH-315-I11]
MNINFSSFFPHWLRNIVALWWLPTLGFILWWYISANSTSFFFPSLSAILSVLYRDLSSGLLVGYLIVSLSNMAIGLSYAIVLGVICGLIIGEFKMLREVTAPLLNFLRSIPPAAVVPIVIVAMGTDSPPKIFIIAMACFWPILLNTIDGVRGIPAQMLETTRAFRIPYHLMLSRVLFMGALPQILAGIRIALAAALVLMVISEFFGASEGIGFYIRNKKEAFAMAETWAGTFLVGVLGYLLSTIFLKIEHWLLAWYFQNAPEEKTKLNAVKQA